MDTNKVNVEMFDSVVLEQLLSNHPNIHGHKHLHDSITYLYRLIFNKDIVEHKTHGSV